jgi:hypothetical protein
LHHVEGVAVGDDLALERSWTCFLNPPSWRPDSCKIPRIFSCVQ